MLECSWVRRNEFVHAERHETRSVGLGSALRLRPLLLWRMWPYSGRWYQPTSEQSIACYGSLEHTLHWRQEEWHIKASQCSTACNQDFICKCKIVLSRFQSVESSNQGSWSDRSYHCASCDGQSTTCWTLLQATPKDGAPHSSAQKRRSLSSGGSQEHCEMLLGLEVRVWIWGARVSEPNG